MAYGSLVILLAGIVRAAPELGSLRPAGRAAQGLVCRTKDFVGPI